MKIHAFVPRAPTSIDLGAVTAKSTLCQHCESGAHAGHHTLASLTPQQAWIEITGLEALADCEEDLDNAKKAKRLRKTARELRELFSFAASSDSMRAAASTITAAETAAATSRFDRWLALTAAAKKCLAAHEDIGCSCDGCRGLREALAEVSR